MGVTTKTNVKVLELYNDFEINYDDWREEYAEITDDDSVLNSRDNDSSFYNWVWDCLNIEWESFLSNLQYYKHDGECVVIGNVGKWNGRFDIVPHKFECLKDAVLACVKSADNVIVNLKDGHLEVVEIHHDGRNYYEIYLLNKLGRVTSGADLSKSSYYRKINDLY